ncbi:MAG: hypothetical protein ACQEQ1_09510, partial [Pseudomonadota bacterium]
PAINTAALLLMAVPGSATAFWGDTLAMEPQPFRQERVLEGRTFQYNDESFIQRNSFTATAPQLHAAPLPRDHIEGTGGSARSKELFLDASVRTTRRFGDEGALDFQYRFRRTEDFDGRYTRNLVGVGVHPGGGLQARLMADVRGDKSLIDLQPELGWQDGAGNAIRFAVVLPEYLFNSKQDEDQYLSEPVTLFSAGEWHPSAASTLRGYISASPETELEVPSLERRFRNESLQGGASVQHQFSDRVRMRWLAEGEATDRHESATTSNQSATMERRAWRSRFALTLGGNRVSEWRLGGEFLSLSESGALIGGAQQLTSRDEHLVFAGLTTPLSTDWRFAPELFVSHVDGESLEGINRQRTSHDGTYAKVSLPFTWSPGNGAQLTLNPTVELHKAAFGGGNLRVRIPL